MDKHYLTPLFAPQSIAVLVGDKDQTDTLSPQAQVLLSNLESSKFSGKLTYVNAHTSATLVELAQSHIDLAVIALEVDKLLPALESVARMGCKAVLILSRGVDEGLADKLSAVAEQAGVILLGPNSMGLQRPHLGLNASAIAPLAQNGSLALVSQSGALTSAILDWSVSNGVGFSTVVSLGPHTSMGLPEALDFLASDGRTQSIVVYMEGIQNARKFMSALRSAANAKPVVVLKAGRKPGGNEAALTHSAAIVGSDDVFDAVLRRAGAVRVNSFVDLFSAAKCLAARYRPVSRRLAVVTNGGGPGVLAADWIDSMGLELGRLSPEVAEALAPQISPLAALTDLINISEQGSPEHYRLALEAALNEPHIGGVLALFTPHPNADAQAFAEAAAQARRRAAKPVLTCWMGDSMVAGGREVLRKALIPTFRTPEAAVGAFSNIADFTQNQQLLQQTPPPMSSVGKKPDIAGARLMIESVLAERRQVLTEMESKTLLAAFHIPVTRTLLARTAREAMMIATQQGFPVALKIDSPDIAHKSDVGGVMLNLGNGEAVRSAYNDMMQRVQRLRPDARINGVTVQNMARNRRGREICIGLVSDDPFGPVITFGAGGTMIELIQDRSMELPPLNQFLARRLMERSRVHETLGEWRGASAVDLEQLEQVLLRVSDMVCALPQLRQMDINPLIVDESGAVAVDARMVIAEQGSNQAHGPYGHLSILPYPARYEQIWPLRDGSEYLVRPIRPDDAQMLQNLVKGLSQQSRYFRFVSQLAELPPAMLARFTLIDYDREMALVAVKQERVVDEDGEVSYHEHLMGVSRYVTNPDRVSCEFALVVGDEFSGLGLGARLMLSIMEVARDKGLERIEGLVLANNPNMLKLMRRLGFEIRHFPDDPEFRLVVHAL